MKSKTILLNKENNVALITFNQPKKVNVITAEVEGELNQVLNDIAVDDNIRVVILTGSGTTFCAGHDISTFESDPAVIRGNLRALKILHPKLAHFRKVVIAAVNGIAAGDGADIALMCDIIIASEKASFSFPGAKLGIVCPYGLIRLADEIGRAKAKELLITGDSIDAKEALDIGLVSKVVPPERLMDAAFELARKIKKRAPISVEAIKEGINRGLGGYEYSYETMVDLMSTDDSKEGAHAFLEKREPRFKGR